MWRNPSLTLLQIPSLLTHGPVDGAENYRHDNEPRVPVVSIVHRGDSEEHEYDRLRTARQHLHRVLDGRVRLMRYIGLNVILHGNTAEGYSEIKGSRITKRAARWQLSLFR